MRLIKIIACLCLLCASPIFAFHTKTIENTIQLGGAIETGNSPTTSIVGKFNSVLNVEPLKQQWGYHFFLEGKRATAQDIETARLLRSDVEGQYLFSKRIYSFAKVNFIYNAFDTYDRVTRDSVGLGWIVVKNDAYKWTLEAGPGSTHQRIAGSKIWQHQFIAHAESTYLWHMSKNADLSQIFQVDSGRLNTLLQSQTALKTKIITSLALQVSYDVNYYTIIPPTSSNTKKTDTSTNLTLIYNF